jgi:hypothetical protein
MGNYHDLRLKKAINSDLRNFVGFSAMSRRLCLGDLAATLIMTSISKKLAIDSLESAFD